MLDAFIIDEIKRKEKEEIIRDNNRPRQEIPVDRGNIRAPRNDPSPYRKEINEDKEDSEKDRGVTIVDYSIAKSFYQN
jgi:hypothetical protein